MEFSVQINREKDYLIGLGINKNIVNSEFDRSFTSVSEISILREELISEYSEEITAFRKKIKAEPVKTSQKEKAVTHPIINKAMEQLIKAKRNCLLDFGISLEVINEAFSKQEIRTALQLDVISNNLLSKYFAAMDVIDTAKSAKFC